MTKADAERRLALSESVVSKWEAMGGPGGSARGNLRMIEDEVAILLGVAAQHVELRQRIEDLRRRYGNLADTIRRSVN